MRKQFKPIKHGLAALHKELWALHKLTPEDYWIKFCEYMYLTQGVDAEQEVSFDSERKNPANASKSYDQDQIYQNAKNVPIIKSGFLWNLGEPAVRTLETRFCWQ